MSSSESSEDEEENKKINEAVIPNDLLSTLTSAIPKSKTKRERRPIDSCSGNVKNDNGNNEEAILSALAIKFKKKERNKDTTQLNLKSNRPDRVLEDEQSAFHATTPGFRAHIEKRLKAILDSDIKGSIQDSVWKKPDGKKEKKQRGIKLFSDVRTLCLGEANTQQHQDINKLNIPPKILPRKHKLNQSSSESSDDEEKINACVFSVDDIMHENRMLENLSKSGIELSSKRADESNPESHTQGLNQQSGDKKEKKCQKDEFKTMKDENSDSFVSSRKQISGKACLEKKEKKMRKKCDENLNNKRVINSDMSSSHVIEHLNKKKKKKKKPENNVEDSVS